MSSEKGKGTTAELWLPLASGQRSPEVPTPISDVTVGESKRVLVVDDDALVLLNTATMAEELGHRVSGEAALSILEENEIDLLITDYSMPKMTRWQAGCNRDPALAEGENHHCHRLRGNAGGVQRQIRALGQALHRTSDRSPYGV